MIHLKFLTTCFFVFVITSLSAQNKKEFVYPNGAKSAISLTYDDGLPSHIHTVIPMLKKYKFKATFYPTLSSPSLYAEMDKWKNLVKEGHELGNHTVYHPCQKSIAGMDWVKDYHNLDKYTIEQISEEIQLANTMLLAIDGKKTRTFAYPCAHFFAGGKNYTKVVSSQFLSARGSSEEQKDLLKLSEIDLHNVPSWAPNNHKADELISYIQSIIDQKTFSTLTFHGIGAEHLIISRDAHEKMLQFLDANRDKIWVAPFEEITAYLKSKKVTKKATTNNKK